jgi:7-carboxy-7-deazaguanine synthase
MTESIVTTGAQTLRVTEIFLSVQGETAKVGLPTVFIRLTGCPLRCHYCDTAYAFSGGESMTLADIVLQVASFSTRHVTLTGGEPLAQAASLALLTHLCDLDYEVSLETSGALDVAPVDHRVIKVLDIKTPGSGESERNRFENLSQIGERDQVKFVITDRDDYRWALAVIAEFDLTRRCEVLMSPSHGDLDAGALADWILEDRLEARLQIQLHKYLWGDVAGR